MEKMITKTAPARRRPARLTPQIPDADFTERQIHRDTDTLVYAIGGLGEPNVFRNPRSQAAERVNAMSQKGVDRLDIPAFLRRQAD